MTSIYIGGTLLFLVVTGLVLLWTVANARYRTNMAKAQVAWSDIATRETGQPDTFTPELVVGQPEIAKRYFNHAIAPGTRLYRRAELTMSGEFLLGEGDAQQSYAMRARQILAPPHEFVWIADMAKGPIRISGSDGLHQSHGWTRFWMFRCAPLIQLAATADLDRAAAARPAIEAIWAPATLLPDHGAVWKQTADDTAEVSFGTGVQAITVTLRIGEDGALKEIWTERWTDANPDKIYKIQTFGAVIEAEEQFGGFTIPSQVTVGNQFGTPDYLPFFRAKLDAVRHF